MNFTAVKFLVEDLEELLQVNNCNVMRENYLNATKMLAYLWSSFTVFIDDHFEKDAKNVDYSGKVYICKICIYLYIFYSD